MSPVASRNRVRCNEYVTDSSEDPWPTNDREAPAEDPLQHDYVGLRRSDSVADHERRERRDRLLEQLVVENAEVLERLKDN